MIPTLLFYKILQLFIAMAFGFILVKCKVLKSDDSTVLSKISLYLLMPAAIIYSFNVELTPEITGGIALAFLSAVIIHAVLVVLDFLCKKFLHTTSVERASIMYSNAANLIIPIVSFILGDEWVVYSCAYMSVQLAFLWTHGIKLFSDKLNLKKILLNVNIISIAIGALLMVLGIKLPTFVSDITSSFGSMLGNVGMVIAGMMAARVDYKKTFTYPRLYLVFVMRMLVYPVITLGIIKAISLCVSIPNSDSVLLISYLASITPSAATVMQFARLHDVEADYSAAINIITTVACIVTMPLFVALYGI